MGAWMGTAMGHWRLEQTDIPYEGMILTRTERCGVGVGRLGGRGWAQSEGMMGVCAQGSLALNLFHMTHTHMASVWTLSFCLSDCLPTSLTLSLGRAMEKKELGGGEGGVEVDISQPQQELCDDRGQAMSHTRGLWLLSLSRRESFIKYPLLFLPVSL